MAELRGSFGEAPNHVLTRWFGTPDLHRLEVYESRAGGYAALRKVLGGMAPADLVICCHVLYGVSDAPSFIAKLETAATERVFVQLERAKVEQGKLYRAAQSLGAALSEKDVLEAGVDSLRCLDLFSLDALHQLTLAPPHPFIELV